MTAQTYLVALDGDRPDLGGYKAPTKAKAKAILRKIKNRWPKARILPA